MEDEVFEIILTELGRKQEKADTGSMDLDLKATQRKAFSYLQVGSREDSFAGVKPHLELSRRYIFRLRYLRRASGSKLAGQDFDESLESKMGDLELDESSLSEEGDELVDFKLLETLLAYIQKKSKYAY